MLLYVRSFLFYLVAFIPTGIFCVTGLLCLFLPRFVLVGYTRLWLRCVFFCLHYVQGISAHVEGRENLPTGPFIVASKHQSTLETFFFPVLFDHPYIILKKSLTHIPFWGWLLHKYDAITIDREDSKKALKDLIEKGEKVKDTKRPLLIFPEGTRTPPGKKTTYKSGIGLLYTRLNLPVVPIAVNTGVVWPRKTFVNYPGKAILKILPPIQPGLDKKDFMARLEHMIEEESLLLMEKVRD